MAQNGGCDECNGEDDPTYLALRDSLKQARIQAQLRPMENRIKATTNVIERAKHRIGEHQANISHLEEQLAEARLEEKNMPCVICSRVDS